MSLRRTQVKAGGPAHGRIEAGTPCCGYLAWFTDDRLLEMGRILGSWTCYGKVFRGIMFQFSVAKRRKTASGAGVLWLQSEATLCPLFLDHHYSLDSVHLHWLQTSNQSKSECDRGVSARRVIWWRVHLLSFVSKQFASCWAAACCGIRTISSDFTWPLTKHVV